MALILTHSPSSAMPLSPPSQIQQSQKIADARLIRLLPKPFFGNTVLNRHCSTRSQLVPQRSKKLALQTRCGLPIISSVPILGPIVNTLLSPVVLLAVYAVGAFRFFSGFSRTTYSESSPTKLVLTLAWPVLFMASDKYRDNFKKAVR